MQLHPREDILEVLEVGDLVEFPRKWYSHWGVYVGDELIVHLTKEDTGNDGINGNIDSGHLFTVPGEIFNKAYPKVDNFWNVAADSRAKINNNKDKKCKPYPPDEVKERALSKIGAVSYNILWSNCEHFAAWCRNGENWSQQMHRDAQVVLEPLDAVRAIQNSRLALERELRIALVGKTGVGKSATANTISGGNYFKSGICAQSVTQICQQQKVTRFGKDISIIDTPGMFDAEADQDDVEREIKRCVHLGAPGLHAVLFVMEIGCVTQENINTMRTFLKLFRSEMENRVIVVFTHGDKLLKKNITLSAYLETTPNVFRGFLEICENRIILFNNDFEKEQSYDQVAQILLMIETLKTANELAFYTDAMFKKAEESVQEREVEIRNNLEMKYKEEYKSTMKSKMQKRRGEIEELRKVYEELLNNVREEIRNEINSKESTCTIL